MSDHTIPPLRALTGLRFVAAAYVVLFHVAQPLARGGPAWVRTLLGGGYVAVGLFFVLSGFILVWAYQHHDLSRPAARRRFWVARLARIYPVYLLGLALALPYFVEMVALRPDWGVAAGLRTAAATLSLTQAWSPTSACQWNCPGWSLSAEAFFYLLFPLLVVATARWGTRRLLAALALLWAAALAAPVAYTLLDPDALGGAQAGSQATWLVVLKFNPLLRLPEFAIGVLVGQLVVRWQRLPATRDRLRRLGPWLSGGAAVTLGVVLATGGRLPFALLHNGLLAPAFALLVVGLGAGGGALARLLGSRPLHALGEASYALYILHVPVYLWSLHRLPFIELGLPHGWPGVALYLVLVTLLSVAVRQRVEEPARRWLLRRPGGRATEQGTGNRERVPTPSALTPIRP